MKAIVISMLVGGLLALAGLGGYVVGWNAGLKAQYKMCAGG